MEQLVKPEQDNPNMAPATIKANNNNATSDSLSLLHPNQQQKHQQKQSSPPNSRFKWTQEKSQVAFNLVKHGYKPKLISVAVGCSLRTAQKFVEQVTPKAQGETFKEFEIKRRGRPTKDINNRLEAIKQVLSNDKKKTQIEIAADLKVSNTTVCRDLKRIGTTWRERSKSTKKGKGKKTKAPKKSNNKKTNKNGKKQNAPFETPIDLDVDVINVEVS